MVLKHVTFHEVIRMTKLSDPPPAHTSLTEVRNVVLLFSNPAWSGAGTVPVTVVRNITALSRKVAYKQTIRSNITTLSTKNTDPEEDIIQGLLYVPDITADSSCDRLQYNYMPRNVTRRSNLPPTNYNLIAIAPWFSIDCTLAYLASASLDPIRGFIFYKPDNLSSKPPEVNSPAWNLNDNGAWRRANKYPIYAIPGSQGQQMTQELSLYSGNISQIPNGGQINTLYGANPKDYVRIWTELSIHSNPGSPEPLWAFFLIVIGALLLIILSVSFTMHFVQRRRRKSLRRRVQSGEVDLEAMGIKRLTVPESHVRTFPLFTYNAEPDAITPAPDPNSPRGTSVRPTRSSRRSRRNDQSISASETVVPDSVRSVRSQRSNIGASSNTAATNDQPTCHICLASFEHRVTIIRELPCGHIFHTECIDEFLTENSSLCPMCKQCMLPAGYSPKITNGMVRRERALRRLRGRIDLDDTDGTAQSKWNLWKLRILTLSKRPTSSELPLTSIKKMPKSDGDPGKQSSGDSHPNSPKIVTNPAPPPNEERLQTTNDTDARTPSKTSRRRRIYPRPFKKLPTQPEDTELNTPAGRESPSSFARERMRQIAAKNAPFEDPDRQRPKWRQAISKVFPGFL